MAVEARDGAGLAAHCNVEVKLLDENAPKVTLASVSSPISEDSAPRTLVACLGGFSDGHGPLANANPAKNHPIHADLSENILSEV